MLKYSAYIQHHIGNDIDFLNSEVVGSNYLEDIYELAETHAKVAMVVRGLKEYVYFVIPLPPGTVEKYNEFLDGYYDESSFDDDDFEDNFMGMCF
jgi:hypothetical protein